MIVFRLFWLFQIFESKIPPNQKFKIKFFKLFFRILREFISIFLKVTLHSGILDNCMLMIQSQLLLMAWERIIILGVMVQYVQEIETIQ